MGLKAHRACVGLRQEQSNSRHAALDCGVGILFGINKGEGSSTLEQENMQHDHKAAVRRETRMRKSLRNTVIASDRKTTRTSRTALD